MNNCTELIDRYIAGWNETNSARRRELIGQTWTEDATYTDPLMRAEGQNGIDTMIQGVQTKFPGFRFTRGARIDEHSGRVRFSWELGPAEGPALVGGTDFGTIVDGRLQAVTGFLDFAPAAQE